MIKFSEPIAVDVEKGVSKSLQRQPVFLETTQSRVTILFVDTSRFRDGRRNQGIVTLPMSYASSSSRSATRRCSSLRCR